MTDPTRLRSVVAAVTELSLEGADRLSGTLAELGLTAPTARALWLIDPAEPAPTMKTMAARLHCNAPNLSFLADQLAARGYVERRPDPDDGRSRVLALTADGVRVRERVIRDAERTSPFAALDPSELAALEALLARALAEARDDEEDPGGPAG